MNASQGVQKPAHQFDFYLILVLFFAGLALRVLVAAPIGFDGLYGQDAYAYYNFAGDLQYFTQTGASPRPFFWPISYPMILALGFTLAGSNPAVGQVINIILGSLLAPLVYILARQAGIRRPGAFTAGLIMLVCGQALQSSIVLMSDIPALAWAVISATALGRYRQSQKRRWLAVASFNLALAATTRWVYLLLIIPWILVVLWSWRERRSWRQRFTDGLVIVLTAFVISAPEIIYSQFNPIPALGHVYLEEWSAANALRSAFTTTEGQLAYDQVNAVYYAMPFHNPFYLSPVFTPFLVLGIWAVIRRRAVPAGQMLFGWLLLPYFFLVGITAQNIRFALILFPPVAVLVGFGIEWALGWAARIHRLPRRYQYLLAAGILATGSVHGLANGYKLTADFISRQQFEKSIVHWAAQVVPADATLYTFGLTLAFEHYTVLPVNDLTFESPALLAQRWRKGRDDYLLVDIQLMETRWQDLAPGIAYVWLRDERGLVRQGNKGDYTLFRVRG